MNFLIYKFEVLKFVLFYKNLEYFRNSLEINFTSPYINRIIFFKEN